MIIRTRKEVRNRDARGDNGLANDRWSGRVCFVRYRRLLIDGSERRERNTR